MSSRLAVILVLCLFLPSAAGAAGPELFQHGGRATAQVGAFTARASDPSAVTYNPAGIALLPGLQFQAGIDFSNASDDYTSPTRSTNAAHTIQFPPSLYLTWKPAERNPWTFGVGVDAAYWYSVDWASALFPGRFLTRRQELRLFELHPVAAYELGGGWSVGGGLRYLVGNLEHGSNFQGTLDVDGVPVTFELENLASANVDALTFDVGVHYDAAVWGFGAVFRGAAELDATDSYQVFARDVTPPDARGAVLARFDFNTARQRFDLPWELRGGVWIAPYPELRVELDASYQAWSGLSDTDVVISSPTRDDVVLDQPRSWDDTLSLRLGVEGEVDPRWLVGGGIAYEPSPVSQSTLEPGFPRADAMVYAVGFTYRLPRLAIDLGYSFHDFDDRSGTSQEVLDLEVPSTYSAKEQVWSLSARWKL